MQKLQIPQQRKPAMKFKRSKESQTHHVQTDQLISRLENEMDKITVKFATSKKII